MNRERLLNVAKALRESPNPERFTMGTYTHPCGTPACALGHYGARRDLQSAFRIDANGTLRALRAGEPFGFQCLPAAATHFDLSKEHVDELFETTGCDGAETAVQAAGYIENFVARHGEVVS